MCDRFSAVSAELIGLGFRFFELPWVRLWVRVFDLQDCEKNLENGILVLMLHFSKCVVI